MNKIFAVLVTALMLSGCASIHVPNYAFNDPVNTISRPHPKKIVASGVTHLTRIPIIHTPKLSAESTAGATHDPLNFADFFPAMAVDAATGEIIAKGHVEFVSSVVKMKDEEGEEKIYIALPMLPNGIFVATLELYCSRSELERAIIFYFSHDGQRIFNSAGIELFEEKQIEKNGQMISQSAAYNPKKFERENEYRLKFREQAISVPVHESDWERYQAYFGLPPQSTDSFVVGQGERWSAFEQYLFEAFPETYEEGDVSGWQIGKADYNTYCRIAHREPGFGSGKRVMREFVLPASSIFAFTGVGAVMAGANVVGQVTSSSMNLNIEGLYGSSTTLRQEMSPLFAATQDMNRVQHERHLLRNAALQRENAALRLQIQKIREGGAP